MRKLGWIVAVIVLVSAPLIAGTPAAAAGPPSLTVSDVSVVEGDAGSFAVKVSVDLSGPSTTSVSVPYRIAPADTSSTAADAQVKSGVVKFPLGAVSRAITETVIGDTVVQADQHFTVHLGTPTGDAVLADPDGAIEIVDDDANGVNPGVEASIGDVTVEEANAGVHLAYLPIILSRPATIASTVSFKADCAVAALLTDITAKTTGTVKFAIGQRIKMLTFKIKADTSPEALMSFAESIKAGVGNVTLLDDAGTTTVIDNDSLWGLGHPVAGFSKSGIPSGPAFNAGAVGSVQQASLANNGSLPHYPDRSADGLDSRSKWASVSADGSQVLFDSAADNLVAGDTNGMQDLFVRDLRAGTTERVSLRPDGSQITQADFDIYTHPFSSTSWSTRASISADGRYVAYVTQAALAPADDLVGSYIQQQDVYVYDRVLHTTTLTSVDAAGHHGGVDRATINGDGRYVAVTIDGTETTLPHPPSGMYDRWLFVHDRVTGTMTQVYDRPAFTPTISADGSAVVFVSYGTECPVGPHIAVVDLATGSSEQVDVTSDGDGAAGLDGSTFYTTPTISADGRYVGFQSRAWNLFGRSGPLPDGSYLDEIRRPYIRDRVAGTTIKAFDRIVGIWDVASISSDGRYFDSGLSDQAVYDTVTGSAIPVGPAPVPALVVSTDTVHALSDDGHAVVFTTNQQVLDGGSGDVFVQRLA